MIGMYFNYQCKYMINVDVFLIFRYDEWIRLEQIVNVFNKFSDIVVLKKKVKEFLFKFLKVLVSLDFFVIREKFDVN